MVMWLETLPSSCILSLVKFVQSLFTYTCWFKNGNYEQSIYQTEELKEANM